MGAGSPAKWFSAAVDIIDARIIPIKQRICLAAAAVVADMGHEDPGDCYLIATAKVRNVPIMTRDTAMRAISAAGYLDIIDC